MIVSGYLFWTTMQPPEPASSAGTAFGTGAVALVGALVGGGFTIGAQMLSAWNQAKVEESRHTAERSMAEEQWVRDTGMRAREVLHPDVRDLLEEFTSVHRELEAAVPNFAQTMGRTSWLEEWSKVWTNERSLKLDVYRELILDEDSRNALKRVCALLDGASNITDEAFTGKPPARDLRTLGMNLSSSGIGIVALYLRNEPYLPKDEPHWAVFEQRLAKYSAWEEAGIEQSIRNAEEAVQEEHRVDDTDES